MLWRGILALAASSILGACVSAVPPDRSLQPQSDTDEAASARFIEWSSIAAPGLPDQQVTIWLPPEYAAMPGHRFPVLYMWDGQNLFDPSITAYNKAWHVDDVLTGMVMEGAAEPHIVVGIWSQPSERYRLYVPQFADSVPAGAVADSIGAMAGGPVGSRQLLDWVADTLKPHIDAQFRTRPGARDTTVVGASMGGLMACFAAIVRPETFANAGCVSAHFGLIDPALLQQNGETVMQLWDDYLDANLGAPDGRRIWMDHGTATMDAHFAPWQSAVATDFARLGWREGEDFTARVYDGAEHDEIAWNARMAEMLAWLWRVRE